MLVEGSLQQSSCLRCLPLELDLEIGNRFEVHFFLRPLGTWGPEGRGSFLDDVFKGEPRGNTSLPEFLGFLLFYFLGRPDEWYIVSLDVFGPSTRETTVSPALRHLEIVKLS